MYIYFSEANINININKRINTNSHNKYSNLIIY